MTVLSKTYHECDSPRREVTFLKLGLWNVQSCANDVKFKDIYRQRVEGRFRLAALTETRMPSGSFKVDGARTIYEGVVGQSTDQSPETSVNGQWVADLLAKNGLKILNTYYEKKKVLKLTWQLSRVSRKAEANSDHYLVVTTLRVKTCTRRIILRPDKQLQAWQVSRGEDFITKHSEIRKIVRNVAASVGAIRKQREGKKDGMKPGLQKKVRLRIKWLKSQKAEDFEAYRRQRNDIV
ncbi:unnamed protein product [Hymenolepis diminuta]|uniref:Uncharacterized protein n=1 Tax=Hymenolepis diminuta TaxID=6216 RepID=A0A564ZE97_HYMDI|nr:unnamed protein product [Hymenolepis diminuta]